MYLLFLFKFTINKLLKLLILSRSKRLNMLNYRRLVLRIKLNILRKGQIQWERKL